MWGAPVAKGWRNHFARTLSYRDCRMVVVYNWNCGYRFREAPGAIAELRAHDKLTPVMGVGAQSLPSTAEIMSSVVSLKSP